MSTLQLKSVYLVVGAHLEIRSTSLRGIRAQLEKESFVETINPLDPYMHIFTQPGIADNGKRTIIYFNNGEMVQPGNNPVGIVAYSVL